MALAWPADLDMNTELPDLIGHPLRAEELELLACLRIIGKGLIAAGSSVGAVEYALADIAATYGVTCEIVALPNLLMIKLGQSAQGTVDLSVQRLTSLKLDQVSELVQLVERVQRKLIRPGEAVRLAERILAKPHRFGSATVIFGYFLSCVGLTLLTRPELRSLAVTGAAGILVGALILWFQRWPRFTLLLPVIAATVVSALVFYLDRMEIVYGSTTLVIPPLVTFLPGAVLTTGMIELASMHIISGSARLMYGAATLFLLFIGIGMGLSISGLPNAQVYAIEASTFPWWAPPLGTLLFGVGMFIRLSGANRDMLWVLLVLYIAMVSQSVGEHYVSPYFGAFLGAACMSLSSELIARSPQRTPALASQVLAFWFLVPGARGLLGVTSLLGQDVQSAAIGIGEMLMLMGVIALGVLLGTLVVSPQKFGAVPVSIDRGAERAS